MCQYVLQVLDGRADRRSEAAKIRKLNPNLKPAIQICKIFLWHRYQYDAEGLPDHFNI